MELKLSLTACWALCIKENASKAKLFGTRVDDISMTLKPWNSQ